ncbi:hypothetical protein GCM10010492_53720 [Saccharothrix mutabilis subsp. mutabilis]|uniref:Uncharacterized protein n=1 Tax=Saccharothrix mutabilis subsp. mutabilis TaxID=66855 RepID=A0ABN0UDV0_9PSEU
MADASRHSFTRSAGYTIRGNIDWASRVTRYTRHHRDTAPGLAAEPIDTADTPVAVESIAWWWDV